jgi:hypothetical protein
VVPLSLVYAALASTPTLVALEFRDGRSWPHLPTPPRRLLSRLRLGGRAERALSGSHAPHGDSAHYPERGNDPQHGWRNENVSRRRALRRSRECRALRDHGSARLSLPHRRALIQSPEKPVRAVIPSKSEGSAFLQNAEKDQAPRAEPSHWLAIQSALEQFHYMQHFLPRAVHLCSCAHLQQTARIRRGNHLCARFLRAFHFLRQQFQ